MPVCTGAALTIYGPKDQWPDHRDEWWNDVLREARARGWTLKRHSDHSWGSIQCPANECYIPPIFSTGRGSENVAKTQKRKVARCRHGSEDQADAVQQVRDHLDAGERFAEAAQDMLDRDANRDEVEELVNLADQSVRSDAEINEAFDRANWYADDHAERAAAALVGTPLEGHEDPDPVVAAAEVEVDQADDSLGAVGRAHADREPLQGRSAALRERVAELRLQVVRKHADE